MCTSFCCRRFDLLWLHAPSMIHPNCLTRDSLCLFMRQYFTLPNNGSLLSQRSLQFAVLLWWFTLPPDVKILLACPRVTMVCPVLVLTKGLVNGCNLYANRKCSLRSRICLLGLGLQGLLRPRFWAISAICKGNTINLCCRDFVHTLIPVHSTSNIDIADSPISAIIRLQSQQGSCLSLSQCSNTQYQSRAPTSTSDRLCTETYVCQSDQFQYKASTTTSDRICSNTTICKATEYTSKPPTQVSDRQCRSCAASCAECTAAGVSNCTRCGDALQYRVVEARNPLAQGGACVSRCSEGYYLDVAASACRALQTCAPGGFEAALPTNTSDRLCVVCAPGSADHDSNFSTPCMVRGNRCHRSTHPSAALLVPHADCYRHSLHVKHEMSKFS